MNYNKAILCGQLTREPASRATSKKTGSDRGNDETREKCAGNDVNERAAQCG